MTSAAGQTPDLVPVEHVVSPLRERLYGAISCLATLAVRRTQLPWWQKLLTVCGLVGVGVVVLGVKILAH